MPAAKKARISKPLRLGPFKRSALVAKMSGDEWQHLVSELLEAEAHRAGLDAADRERSLAANKGDGGVDFYLGRTPPNRSEFIPAGPTVFQFKRSFSSIAALASEILGSEFLQGKLAAGSAYVLVLGSELGTKRGDIEKSLAARLKRKGLRPKIEVFGPDWILRFLKEHPFAWPYVPDAPNAVRHLKTLSRWVDEQAKVGSIFEWTEDPERSEIMASLLAQLERGGQVLRLQGPPGVGKTRLALELAKRFALSNRDVVFLEADEPGTEDLSDFPGTTMQGLLVIDECSAEKHEAIRRNWKSTRGSALTIGAEDERKLQRDDPTRPWLGPLQMDQVRQLARTASSKLDEPSRLALAEKSGGYLKLFRLLLDAVATATPTALSATNLSQEQLVDLLVRFITKPNDQGDARSRAIEVLSLPMYIANQALELPILASAVGLTRHDLLDAKSRLDRLALVGRLSGGFYVTPRLLGDWLAERCWARGECDLLAELRRAGASSQLLWRCAQRLAGGTRNGLASLRELLGGCRDELEKSLGGAAVSELVAQLAGSHPAEALGLATILLDRPPSELSEEAIQATRRALGRCAWEPELFDRAAQLLTMLSSGEESGFRDLFGTVLGMTRADGRQRLSFLERLGGSPEQRTRLLLARSLEEALRDEAGRFVPYPGLKLKDAWRPKTRAEEHEYRSAAASLLVTLFADGDLPVRAASLDAARRCLRPLIRTGFADVAVQLIHEAVEKQAPLEAFRDEARIIDEFDFPRLDSAGRALWTRARSLLAPRNAFERALAFARAPSRGEAPIEEALAIAKQSLAEPDVSTLLEAFGKEFYPASFDLGRAFGSIDDDRRLLGLVTERAGSWRVLRFAAGYLVGMGGATEGVLDALSETPQLAKLVFEATWLATPSVRGAERLMKMHRRGLLEPGLFAQLKLGGWLTRVDSATANRFLGELQQSPVVAFELAFQRVMGTDGDRSLEPMLVALWSRIEPTSIKSVSWEWLEVAALVPTAVLTARCVEAVKALSGSGELLPDELLEALAVAAKRAPKETWRELAGAIVAMDGDERLALEIGLRTHLPETPELTDEILTWVGSDVERAGFAAEIALPISQSASGLAAALLERFPDDPIVGARLTNRFMSGQFHQESDFWRERLAVLGELKDSSSPAVANWARRMLPVIEESLQRAVEVEQAYSQGVLPLPMSADRLPE